MIQALAKLAVSWKTLIKVRTSLAIKNISLDAAQIEIYQPCYANYFRE